MVEADGSVLTLTGPVVIETHAAMRERAAAYIGQADWTIDWARVTDVDSSALALIFAWQRDSSAHGKALRTANLPANLLSLAELYGVAEMLPPT